MTKQFNDALITQYPRLRAYALKLTRNLHEAEDLLQNTAVLALRFESKFAAGTNFSGWAHRIMKNSFLSGCRGNHRRPISIDDAPLDALAMPERVVDHIMVNEATRAMDKLTPDSKTLLNLIYQDELSYQEASHAMDCSVGTIKSRLWRARARMKELLGLDVAFGRAPGLNLPAAA